MPYQQIFFSSGCGRGTYRIVGQLHEFRDQLLLLGFVRLRRDHVANCLIKGVDLADNSLKLHEHSGNHTYLLWREIYSDTVK